MPGEMLVAGEQAGELCDVVVGSQGLWWLLNHACTSREMEGFRSE